jgi:hypothetical protein
MPLSNLTELALRAAVNTTQTEDASAKPSQCVNVKEAALKRVKELIGGNNTLSDISSQLNVQSIAIGLAVQGLELAYSAISGQIDQLNDKRLAFDKELQAGISTFMIPTNKEQSALSKQEKVIKSFVELINKNPSFSRYFGIQTGSLADLNHMVFYSVLPFYRMSDALEQPVASARTLDKQRIAVNLFFRSVLPEAINCIDTTFQTEHKFVEFWRATFKQDNYLNDYRSQRFILMSLANLLWNLQYPVDSESGFPLGVDRSIELCREVAYFLNKILSDSESAYINEIGITPNQLLCFVRKIETHVKSLRLAFIEEHLYELNISDLTNSAHQTLRTMDKSVFELIYSQINVVTKKVTPDGKAAEELAYIVSYLNQLLVYNCELMQAFTPFTHTAKNSPFLNNPLITVMDALIVFIHCTSDERRCLLKTLEQNRNDSAVEFTETLKKLDLKFIHPIKEIHKKELEVTTFSYDKKKRDVALLNARRLLPLISLVLEDYRIEVDTPSSYRQAKQLPLTMLAKDQVIAINKLAEQDGDYYRWQLSPFIEFHPDTEAELDQLPKHQYRFTQLTKLLDSVSEIVKNYRSFLQLKSFQRFLIKCLNRIQDEYKELEQHIAKVDACLVKDKSINRNMQSILGPMTHNLTSGLTRFSVAFASFEHVISAPDFTEKQKQVLSAKMGSIHEQFSALFGEDCEIASLALENGLTTPKYPVRALPQEASTSPRHSRESPPVLEMLGAPHTSYIESRRPSFTQMEMSGVVLRHLVVQCHDALSYQSKYSQKGKLLTNILSLMDAEPHLTKDNISTIIQELGKITLSYRPTLFFQAAYGETRSAKIFIAAMKNFKLNALLPINAVMFGEMVSLAHISDQQIAHRLRAQAKSNQWQESVNNMPYLTSLD